MVSIESSFIIDAKREVFRRLPIGIYRRGRFILRIKKLPLPVRRGLDERWRMTRVTELQTLAMVLVSHQYSRGKTKIFSHPSKFLVDDVDNAVLFFRVHESP